MRGHRPLSRISVFAFLIVGDKPDGLIFFSLLHNAKDRDDRRRYEGGGGQHINRPVMARTCAAVDFN